MAGRRRHRFAYTAPYVERFFWRAGLQRVAGVDEVGMGPLAGPVVAAAVVFADGRTLDGITDSKALAADARERAARAIHAHAAGVGIGVVEVADIDRLNIYQAGLEAMRRALAALPVAPEYVLVDGREIPGVAVPQTRFVQGDTFVYSVAAASIVAKVHRDALMRRLDAVYPRYGFARHVGYATPEHLAALRVFGPTPLHRLSFAPCAEAADVAARSAPGRQ
jgi:ribonuclease HII